VTGKARTGTITTMEAKTWMLDELAHAGPEHLDPGFVAGFDRKQGYPDFSADVSVLAAHGAGQEATVVDLGTGTGRFALAAAPHLRRVIAVDVSPAMLAVARGRAATAGLANIECVQAGFLSYQHTRPPSDAVFTRNALHQLPDFWKALALHRIADVLRPGGVVRLHDLIFDFQPADAGTVLERWLDSGTADPASGYTRERTTRSTSAPSTAPSDGSWSPCSPQPGSTSWPPTSAGRSTAPTPALSADIPPGADSAHASGAKNTRPAHVVRTPEPAKRRDEGSTR
jgi:SAM-dependent methyltransferase